MPQHATRDAVDLDRLEQRSKELDHLRGRIVALLALLVQQTDLGINDEGRIDRLFCLWVDRYLSFPFLSFFFHCVFAANLTILSAWFSEN